MKSQQVRKKDTKEVYFGVAHSTTLHQFFLVGRRKLFSF